MIVKILFFLAFSRKQRFHFVVSLVVLRRTTRSNSKDRSIVPYIILLSRDDSHCVRLLSIPIFNFKMTATDPITASRAPPKSPFFRPSDKPDFTQTPGGTRRPRSREPNQVEHKSTIIGCSANLINAIVGSGIVGLPFAVKEAGFCAGIMLVILCGFLTEKSLRLLVETAKHAHVPSYETVSEAAFGRFGFLFVAIST
jgi:Transmembrane amino acid transporter protein